MAFLHGFARLLLVVIRLILQALIGVVVDSERNVFPFTFTLHTGVGGCVSLLDLVTDLDGLAHTATTFVVEGHRAVLAH